jgi:hypothetical protein
LIDRCELLSKVKERFFLESGMFFHCPDHETAEEDYNALLDLYGQQAPLVGLNCNWLRIIMSGCSLS